MQCCTLLQDMPSEVPTFCPKTLNWCKWKLLNKPTLNDTYECYNQYPASVQSDAPAPAKKTVTVKDLGTPRGNFKFKSPQPKAEHTTAGTKIGNISTPQPKAE